MPRLDFLTNFACLGQFFNVLVEISPEYWCVPSVWSSQYHGDWHEVLIKFLPGLSSVDISSKQVQQGWTNRGSSFTGHWGDWRITVIWYWLWNFPTTLKTIRVSVRQILDFKEWVSGYTVLWGCACLKCGSFRFWTFCFSNKKGGNRFLALEFTCDSWTFHIV